jgi:tetratricopeptide (TPR) repeat protein
MMREISIADSRPSVSNCEEFLESLMEVFVQHGLDLSCYKTLFNVTEGIISIIEIDDEEKYLRFIEDAFASMQDYQWTSGLEMCINEMKNILEGGMIGDASDMVLLYDYQAFMEVSRGNYKDAAKFEEKALSFTEKTGDGNLLLLANVNANLGQDYMHLEMPSEAEKYLSVAIEIMKKTDMTRLNDLVPMQANYALLLQKKGELEKAKSILDNLKTIVGEMNSYNGKDYAFLEILTGNIYMGEGIVDMAEEHYQSARDIYADIYSDDPELIEIKDKEIMQLMAYFGSMHGKVIGRYLKGHLK